MAKATRGDVARLVLSADRIPEDAESVAALLTAAGLKIELSQGNLDVVVGKDGGQE